MIHFTVAFTRPGTVKGRGVAVIQGEPRSHDDMTVGDITHTAPEVERYLSRILGLTVKIESEMT